MKGGVVTNIQQIERNKQIEAIERKRHERRAAIHRDEIPDDDDYEVKGEKMTQQIDRILDGSVLTFLQRGVFGGVFSAKYNGESGFFNFETNTPVNDFIVKVQAIDFEMAFPFKPGRENLDRETTRTTLASLRREVTLQNALVERALKKNLLPPCPSILSYKIVDLNKLNSYVKGQIVFEDKGVQIEPTDYSGYSAAIVLMEFVSAPDVTSIDQTDRERYVSKYQEIRNKAFRAYCTALKLGVDQRDVTTSNYLFSDGRITMIDFGVAMPTDPEIFKLLSSSEENSVRDLKHYVKYKPEIDKLIDKAEKGNYQILRRVLSKYPELVKLIDEEKGNYEEIMEILKSENPELYKMIKRRKGPEENNYHELREYLRDYNPLLDEWLLEDEYGLTVFEPVNPIRLTEDIAARCRSGLCELTIPVERKRPKAKEAEKRPAKKTNVNEMDRYDYEVRDRELRKAAESEEKSKKWGFFGWGGKRHTKYVGTRRHKKSRTRRKV